MKVHGLKVIIRLHISIGMHPRLQTCAMLLFLVMLENLDVCTVTMGVACPLLHKPLGTHQR